MRCFGHPNAWLNFRLQNQSSRRYWPESLRQFYRHAQKSEKNAKMVVYGHIHCPYIRRLQGLTVANAGSVSQSYDGDRRASYLVIDGENITIRRVEYDIESEAEELLRSGLPNANWFAGILLAGKYCPPD